MNHLINGKQKSWYSPRSCVFLRLAVITFLVLLIFSPSSLAQTTELAADLQISDSLKKFLQSAPDNSEKCRKLFSEARALRSKNVDAAIYLTTSARKIAKKQKDTTNIVQSYFTLADIYYWGLSDYAKTELELDTLKTYYFENLTGTQKARYFSQVGDLVYFDNELVRSMENYYRALEYAGTDSVMLARLYHNLGWVYADLGKYDKAIYYGLEALRVAELSKGDKVHKMNGLVYIYENAKMFDKAFEYIQKVEKIETSNPEYYAYQKANLYLMKGDTSAGINQFIQGVGFARQNNSVRWEMNNLFLAAQNLILTDKSNEALPYFKQYEKLALQYEKEYEVAALYALLGKNFLQRSIIDSAGFYLNKAEKIQLKFKQREIGDTYKSLSDLYFAKGNIHESRAYLLKYISHADSLKKEEEKTAAKVKDDMLKMYELENSLNTKDAEILKRNLLLEKEKLQKYGFLGGLIIAVLLGMYVFRAYRQKRTANIIITRQKKEMEKQKAIVEEKQKEILDSIHYAKRIQNVLLTSEKYIERNLKKLKGNS